MRRILSLLCVVFLLGGCGKKDTLPDKIMSFRQRLLNGGCVFDTEITADYGDRTYTFAMNCKMEKDGSVVFTVTAPESIAGITGVMSEMSGGLTFDDQVLAFEMLADGQITPVSAPWHMLEALRGGFLHGYCETDEGMLVQINDSYKGENLLSEIHMDREGNLLSCELYWSERRFMTLSVSNFAFL